jgi:hypothetical protein
MIWPALLLPKYRQKYYLRLCISTNITIKTYSYYTNDFTSNGVSTAARRQENCPNFSINNAGKIYKISTSTIMPEILTAL